MPASSKEKNREYVKRYRAKNPGYEKKYRTPERNKAYRETHRAKNPDYRRREHLKKAYDLTLEAYEALLQTQQGKCRICQTVPTKQLYVDHDHTTGRVRGLLCHKCNSMIGFAEDNIDRLLRAIDYLKGNL